VNLIGEYYQKALPQGQGSFAVGREGGAQGAAQTRGMTSQGQNLSQRGVTPPLISILREGKKTISCMRRLLNKLGKERRIKSA